MKSLKMLAVILLAGIVVASALMSSAQADPGKVKLKISCTGAGGISINNALGSAAVTVGPCLVNGVAPYPFHANSDLDIDVASTVATNPVTLFLTDGTMNEKYKVKGDRNSAITMFYTDNTGDDKLDVKGDGNDALFVNDGGITGAGNDDYKGKDISFFIFVDSPTPDMDKIDIKTA